MDGECAFCGRADEAALNPIFCEDCQSQHRVCASCTAEVASEAPSYGLVA
jgi:hypothetical protein